MKIILLLSLALGTPAGLAQTTGRDHDHTAAESNKTVYTCPMHPHIKNPEPGSCPVCGMDLVLLEAEPPAAGNDTAEAITLTKATRRLAGIETEKVRAESVYQKIRAVGSISYDEGRVATISAHVDGRIEKLYADYKGVLVKKNEHLAEFYSPDLYSAQVEYLQAGEALLNMRDSGLVSVKRTQQQLLSGARTKLRELGMTPGQINRLKKSRKARSRLTMVSQVTGTVIEKKAVEGSYVKKGQVIYKVADLSTVWLLLDLFPEEITYLKFGLKVNARVRSSPDQEFSGRISFIDPVIDRKTRTVRVRVEIPNGEGLLKPGDFADATIDVPVRQRGSRGETYDPDLAGKFISPMHPQIISDKPGKCPICGMTMVPAAQFGYSKEKTQEDKIIAIPRDAVLTVGKTSVVFVESAENRFSLRRVSTGPVAAGNRIVILRGLEEGETIAATGVFLIDSQMQLSGKTSLMQITSGQGPAGGDKADGKQP